MVIVSLCISTEYSSLYTFIALYNTSSCRHPTPTSLTYMHFAISTTFHGVPRVTTKWTQILVLWKPKRMNLVSTQPKLICQQNKRTWMKHTKLHALSYSENPKWWSNIATHRQNKKITIALSVHVSFSFGSFQTWSSWSALPVQQCLAGGVTLTDVALFILVSFSGQLPACQLFAFVVPLYILSLGSLLARVQFPHSPFLCIHHHNNNIHIYKLWNIGCTNIDKDLTRG